MVFASKNKGKIKELKALLEGIPVELVSIDDYPGIPDIVEDGSSFFENAMKKATLIFDYTGQMVIADDSGLDVDFLGGRPGVHSSRYAGADATDEENNEKLLSELAGVPDDKRRAAFRCVLILFEDRDNYESFEGKLEGKIGTEPKGSEGFGYDPVFIVTEYGKTVAELGAHIKNRISHRAIAFQKLKKSLKE
ncbi:MAG: XTP/dITP diphosphatase [Thermodesulfobacteriota bacterium]|nr:XTP/dITP diphosphatase [Thermodesulfobacteriota bacterium]